MLLLSPIKWTCFYFNPLLLISLLFVRSYKSTRSPSPTGIQDIPPSKQHIDGHQNIQTRLAISGNSGGLTCSLQLCFVWLIISDYRWRPSPTYPKISSMRVKRGTKFERLKRCRCRWRKNGNSKINFRSVFTSFRCSAFCVKSCSCRLPKSRTKFIEWKWESAVGAFINHWGLCWGRSHDDNETHFFTSRWILSQCRLICDCLIAVNDNYCGQLLKDVLTKNIYLNV